MKIKIRGHDHKTGKKLRTIKEFSGLIRSVALFKGLELPELETMLACIGAEMKSVRKGGIVLLAGDEPRQVGLVLEGLLHVIREDYNGNRSLLAAAAPGDLFAEALCCAEVSESPVTVTARADSVVELLSFARIISTCPNSCAFHTKLISNMLGLIAGKNLSLQSRMEIVSLKSVRAKVKRYLETLVPAQGRNITIPFNREELADFLCVERSALSHELAKMRKDGLIEYRKNRFVLHWGGEGG